MKNIILIFLTVTTLLSCSNDKNQEDYTIPPELIGTWQFKGIYAHDVYDENNMPLYTPYENDALLTYFENNTFTNVLEDASYTGTYTVINSLIIKSTHLQASTNTTIQGSNKISLLTENILEIKCVSGDLCDTYRYEKVASD